MNIPYGYCHCGCGQKTKIATRNNARWMQVKGQPNRFLQHHSRGVLSRKLPSNSESFWERVDVLEDKNACWNWKGGKSKKGYGLIKLLGKHAYAHRVAYEFANRNIDPDLDVLHSCDNPSCCNPAHLRMGTHQENMRDRDLKGRGRSKSKLTWDDVNLIRQQYADGVCRYRLSINFDVKFSTIDRIVKGETWIKQSS